MSLGWVIPYYFFEGQPARQMVESVKTPGFYVLFTNRWDRLLPNFDRSQIEVR